MKLGKCLAQGRPRTFERLIGGRRVVFHLPKRGNFTIREIDDYIRHLGLNQIKMVDPGVISPRRFAYKVAYFQGDILKAMETLTADARHFYHKALFPSSM